jgi:hypothetical protein
VPLRPSGKSTLRFAALRNLGSGHFEQWFCGIKFEFCIWSAYAFKPSVIFLFPTADLTERTRLSWNLLCCLATVKAVFMCYSAVFVSCDSLFPFSLKLHDCV